MKNLDCLRDIIEGRIKACEYVIENKEESEDAKVIANIRKSAYECVLQDIEYCKEEK